MIHLMRLRYNYVVYLVKVNNFTMKTIATFVLRIDHNSFLSKFCNVPYLSHHNKDNNYDV